MTPLGSYGLFQMESYCYQGKDIRIGLVELLSILRVDLSQLLLGMGLWSYGTLLKQAALPLL